MKTSFWTEYRALSSHSYRLLTLSLFVLLPLLEILGSRFIGIMGALIATQMAMFFLCLFDYYIFSGISIRKQKSMEIFKSSLYGERILLKALKADQIVKSLTILIAVGAGVILTLTYDADPEEKIYAVAILMASFPVTGAVTRITLLLSRRYSATIISQIIITYIASQAFSMLLAILFLATPQNPKYACIICGIIFVVSEATSIILARILINDCIKGYLSGFSDTFDISGKES